MAVGRILPEAAGNLWRKPATVLYPQEKLPVPEGFRGAPVVNGDLCIGCRICARQCPAGAIEMAGAADAKASRPIFHDDACIFCAVCADACPKKAIAMSTLYALAAGRREALVRHAGPAGAEEGE